MRSALKAVLLSLLSTTLSSVACGWKFQSTAEAGKDYFKGLRYHITSAAAKAVPPISGQDMIQTRAQHIGEYLTSSYDDSKWGVIAYSAPIIPGKESETFKVLLKHEDMDWKCNRTLIPQPNCALVGGALMHSVRTSEYTGLLRVVLLFITDIHVLDSWVAKLQQIGAASRKILTNCILTELALDSKHVPQLLLDKLAQCIHNNFQHRYQMQPLLQAVSYHGRTGHWLAPGGVVFLKTDVKGLKNFDLYIFPKISNYHRE